MSNIRILIADDEEDMRELLTMSFQSFGFEVKAVADGAEALVQVTEFEPQILITDVRMPKVNGITLLKSIRQLDAMWPKVFIISGFNDFPLEDIYNYGAEGIFPKPFDINALKDTIRKALVSPDERWAPPITQADHWQELKFPSLEDAVRLGHLKLPRGGIFLSLPEFFPQKNSTVFFDFNFQKPTALSNLTGVGEVVWVRPKNAVDDGGVGIEIRYLCPSCRKDFIRAVENTTEYIPHY